MALAGPFFQAFELQRRIGLLIPEISFAHVLDGNRARIAYRSLDRTASGLGRDGTAYRRLFRALVQRADGITDFTQHQLIRIPHDPLAAVAYGARTLEQGGPWWNLRFAGDTAPAMVTGVSGHSMGILPGLPTAAAGLLLGAHAHVLVRGPVRPEERVRPGTAPAGTLRRMGSGRGARLELPAA